MAGSSHDFSDLVERVPSLDHYLSQRRRNIGGPRTLAEAFVRYRMSLMAGSVRLPKQQDDSVRKLNPGKINWIDAYGSWQDQKKGIAPTDKDQ